MNIYDLSFDALEQLIVGWGESRFRAKQVWHWLYTQKVDSANAMTNLPKGLRQKLIEETTFGNLELITEQVSDDGTRKRLYRLPDGQLIESVLMAYNDGRRTACISSQAGCAMGCVFCATGQMGFARHLTAGEIVEQALHYARLLEAQDETLEQCCADGDG